jgi:hypothetical protein
VVNPLPLGDKPLAIIGALAVLGCPALRANIEAGILLFILEEECVELLFICERLPASLAGMSARLDIPFVHQASLIIVHLSTTATFYLGWSPPETECSSEQNPAGFGDHALVSGYRFKNAVESANT